MKSVEVKNLVYSYTQNVPVLRGISFDVNKGEYVSIVGHNGCGKSTLCKLLIGLLSKDSGDITVNGLELNRKNIQEIRKKVAIVFQNPDNQFIGATVEDDIAFSLENMNVSKDEMKEKVIEYASKVGMVDFLNKEPSYLSGGQKQRVAIADALVREPDILILDEATSMLDPNGKEDILNLVKKMREDNPNLTVISITHDIEEAYESDRIILLNKGEIVLSCAPEELFNNIDTINKYGLELPFIVKLKQQCSLLGIDASKCKTIEEIGELICQSR